MNIVFLSPHFPPAMARYCARLRELGATVLGIADAPYHELSAELKDALTEYYQVRDLHDFDAMVRALGWFTHRHGKIDRIESLNEYWLETDAALRTAFHVEGLREDTIARVKSKAAMKAVFEAAGIEVARGRVARTPEEVRAFVAEVGGPVIAKPDVGVGAARTWRLAGPAEVNAFLAEKPPVDYILEEELTGTLLTFDGLVDREGRLVFTSSLVYGITVLDAVNGGDMYYWIDREIPSDLAEAGERIIRAFDVRERPFHFEFFRQPSGRLAALEVNMRQPGGLTVDMWNFANDCDIYRAWAEVVVRGSTFVRQERPFHVLWAGRKWGKPYRLSEREVRARFADLLVHAAPVEPVFSAAIGNFGFILRHPDLDVLQAARAEIQEIQAPA